MFIRKMQRTKRIPLMIPPTARRSKAPRLVFRAVVADGLTTARCEGEVGAGAAESAVRIWGWWGGGGVDFAEGSVGWPGLGKVC